MTYAALLAAVADGELVIIVTGTVDVLIEGERQTMRAVHSGSVELDERALQFALHEDIAVRFAQMIGFMHELRTHGCFHPV